MSTTLPHNTTGIYGGSVPFVENGFPSTAFVIHCSALVMIMTPSVGLFYSGFSRSKNALTVIMLCFLSYAVVSIQWLFFGFSLAFSETGSPFIGDFGCAGLTNLGWQAFPLTAPGIPAIVYALFELQFAAMTTAIIFGSVVERVRMIPCVVFMFTWTTLIYDPVAYSVWAARGWIKNLDCLSTTLYPGIPCQIGALDYAGGGPIHIAAGAASLAFCIFLGHRKFSGHDESRPHNITNIFLGTALLWMGWIGFNAGSALSATPRAGYAAINTVFSASSGALAWVVLDFQTTKKLSGVAFCSGSIAGLVGITPGAGYIPAWSSIIVGALSALGSAMSIRVKDYLGYDDSADAWGVHGASGVIGCLLTGIFASPYIMALDGSVNPGGVIAGNWKLLGYNAISCVFILVYTFFGTYAILMVINIIPTLHFRQTLDEEMMGGDIHEMGGNHFKFDI
jgi:Amt family ammonium transporter